MRATRHDPYRAIDPLRRWAHEWAGDCHPRIRLFAYGLRDLFRRFLLHQIQAGRSSGTLLRHRNELYTLGYECIRSIQLAAPASAPPDARSYLIALNLDQGGPLLSSRFASERDQDRFDTTCRALGRWISRAD